MHGSRIFFALLVLEARGYTGANHRSNTDRPKFKKDDEETPMNPIRIVKNWLAYRRTLNELGSLSNHALNDIGLTRYDIRNVAARTAR